MVQELQPDQTYYLDLLEDELAFTCWRQYTEFGSSSSEMLERKSTILEDYLEQDEEYDSEEDADVDVISQHSRTNSTLSRSE